MGEARQKRRRQADIERGATVQALDLITGQPRSCRLSPPVDTLLKRQEELVDRLRRGERDIAASVPCAGCTACCRGGEPIGVDELDDASVPFLRLTPPDSTGMRYLQRRTDSSCVHLGLTGCEVYEHRPLACRLYDCRVAAAFGVEPRCDPDHPFPEWLPTSSTREDLALNRVAQTIGMLEARRAHQAGETWSVADLLPRLVAQYLKARETFVQLFRLFRHMSAAERARLAEEIGEVDPIAELRRLATEATQSRLPEGQG